MADIVLDFKSFKNTKELTDYCTAQHLALVNAAEKITQLQEKVTHLEELLKSSVPGSGEQSVDRILKSPELCIIESQILHYMNGGALSGKMQLEDIKALDILIKNKNLLSNQPTTIPGESKPKKGLNSNQLTNIARIKRDE